MFDRQLKHAIAGHMARGNELSAQANGHMARGNELSVQTNGHMARGNELSVQTNGHMARGNELMAEVRHEIELSRRDRADMAVFIRDITTRIERGGEATVRAIDANTATLGEMGAALRDMRSDMEANRQAILSVIDRLDPPA